MLAGPFRLKLSLGICGSRCGSAVPLSLQSYMYRGNQIIGIMSVFQHRRLLVLFMFLLMIVLSRSSISIVVALSPMCVPPLPRVFSSSLKEVHLDRCHPRDERDAA